MLSSLLHKLSPVALIPGVPFSPHEGVADSGASSVQGVPELLPPVYVICESARRESRGLFTLCSCNKNAFKQQLETWGPVTSGGSNPAAVRPSRCGEDEPPPTHQPITHHLLHCCVGIDCGALWAWLYIWDVGARSVGKSLV